METLPCLIEPTGKIKKGIILAAGLVGNKHFPSSSATSINLFPIVQFGVSKPSILVQVEDLVDSGIEEIIIVIQPADVTVVEQLFHKPISATNMARLSTEAQKVFARKLRVIGSKVKIVVQERQDGMVRRNVKCRSSPTNLISFPRAS